MLKIINFILLLSLIFLACSVVNETYNTRKLYIYLNQIDVNLQKLNDEYYKLTLLDGQYNSGDYMLKYNQKKYNMITPNFKKIVYLNYR